MGFRNSWVGIVGYKFKNTTKRGSTIPAVMIMDDKWYESDNILIANEKHRDEILDWIDENDIMCIVKHTTGTTMIVFFTNEEDAMAFKLRWGS